MKSPKEELYENLISFPVDFLLFKSKLSRLYPKSYLQKNRERCKKIQRCSESEEERASLLGEEGNKNYDIGKEAADAQMSTYHHQENAGMPTAHYLQVFLPNHDLVINLTNLKLQ